MNLRLPCVLALGLATAGCAPLRVDQAARVAAGFASHTLCDDVFISGVDPDTAYAQRVRPQPGMGLVAWALKREVDRDQREVRVTIGSVASRARWQPGQGCLALPEGEIPPDTAAAGVPTSPPQPDPWGSAPVAAANPRLRAALDRALTDLPGQPAHRTKAVVVLQGGRLLGERYAPGYGVETPVLGFSMTKSLTNALVGVLVRQGRLPLDRPAPLTAWQDGSRTHPGITVEQLLRQTAGLQLPQDNSGFDITSQIMYTVRDKAAAAASAPQAGPPGTRWAYTDTNYVLLSRLIRDAVGGRAADVTRFAQAELFGPLGLRHAAVDFDATGTPVGSSHGLASGRDWARFGQLALDDGVVNGRRILPEGWMAMSTTPTLDTGYGAGWWTNRKPGNVPHWGVPWGLPSAPADAFFARGFMGNFVVVVPSRQLVLVRLSVSAQRGDDIEETDRIVGEVLAALADPPQ